MKYNYKYTNKEIDANSTLIEVIQGINQNNFVDAVRILKKKFGVQYNVMCDVLGVSPSVIKTCILYGTTERVISEERLAEGILILQRFYLGEDYISIEKEAEFE